MSQGITVEKRDVYGQTKYYPLCDKAKLFAAIAGTKTLTEPTIISIVALGYRVGIVPSVNKFEGEIA
jgi:hypothetical protein